MILLRLMKIKSRLNMLLATSKMILLESLKRIMSLIEISLKRLGLEVLLL